MIQIVNNDIGSADGAMTAGVLHTACENAEDSRDRHPKTGETAGVTAEVLPIAFKDGNTGEVGGKLGTSIYLSNLEKEREPAQHT